MLEAEFLSAGIIEPLPQHVNGQSRFGKRARQFEARHLVSPLVAFCFAVQRHLSGELFQPVIEDTGRYAKHVDVRFNA